MIGKENKLQNVKFNVKSRYEIIGHIGRLK